MQNMIFIVVLLAVGVLIRLLGEFRERDPAGRAWVFAVPDSLADALTSFVIYVSLPALILARIPGLTISGGILAPVVIPWLLLAVSAVMVLGMCRLFGWSRETKALLLLLVPLGNTSFLGIPMVDAFFGAEGIQYALLYDQIGSFLSLAIYGTVVVAYFGSEGGGTERPTAGRVIRGILAFPPFIALIIALFLRGAAIPEAVNGMFTLLGDTLVPLVMIAVGFKIRFTMERRSRVPLTVGLGIKMVIAPLLALAGCRLLGLRGLAVDVTVFEAGMPPMISAWALAMKAGFEPELGAAMVGFGILVSFVTLSLLSFLL